jgi:hypothetical protein
LPAYSRSFAGQDTPASPFNEKITIIIFVDHLLFTLERLLTYNIMYFVWKYCADRRGNDSCEDTGGCFMRLLVWVWIRVRGVRGAEDRAEQAHAPTDVLNGSFFLIIDM